MGSHGDPNLRMAVAGDDQVGDPHGADKSLAINDGQAPKPMTSHVLEGVVDGIIGSDGRGRGSAHAPARSVNGSHSEARPTR